MRLSRLLFGVLCLLLMCMNSIYAFQLNESYRVHQYDWNDDQLLDIVISPNPKWMLMPLSSLILPMGLPQAYGVAMQLEDGQFNFVNQEGMGYLSMTGDSIADEDHLFADFNVDGALDLWVRLSATRSVIIYGGDDTANNYIHMPQMIDFAGLVEGVAFKQQVEDRDLDGYLDILLVAPNQTTPVSIAYGSYNGLVMSFPEEAMPDAVQQVESSSGFNPSDTLYSGDFNGDGLADWLILPKTRHTRIDHHNITVIIPMPFTVLLTQSDGSAVLHVSRDWDRVNQANLYEMSQQLHIADFNNDGARDLSFAGDTDRIWLILSDGVEAASLLETNLSNAFNMTDAVSLEPQDVDGDDQLDILVKENNMIVGTAFLRGDRLEIQSFEYSEPAKGFIEGNLNGEFRVTDTLYSGDFNDDGLADWLILPETRHIRMGHHNITVIIQIPFTVLLTQSDGSAVLHVSRDWDRVNEANLHEMSQQLHVADFNNDGARDLSFSGDAGRIWLILSDGAGATNLLATNLSDAFNVTDTLSWEPQDVDDDGQLDILVKENNMIVGTAFLRGDRLETQSFEYPEPLKGFIAGNLNGEFRVTQLGAAEYHLPIELPAGKDGMQPSLSVNYSSQAGNGVLGLGWNLNYGSVIARCNKTIAQDGIADGVDLDSTDVYCLNGDRLRMRNPNDAYLTPGKPMYTEMESFLDVQTANYANGSPINFMAFSREGVSQIFAASTKERVVYPIYYERDLYGNSIKYRHHSDNALNVRLEEIEYGDYMIQFSYRDRSDVSYRYDFPTQLEEQKHLLSEIAVFDGENKLYSYIFFHIGQDASTGMSRLSHIYRCVDQECLLPHRFEYESPAGNLGQFSDAMKTVVTVPPQGVPQVSTFDVTNRTGDFNADGLTDLMVFPSESEAIVFLSDGQGGFDEHVISSVEMGYPHSFRLPAYEGIEYSWLPGDHDGDGDTDFVHVINDHYLIVWLSNGDGTFSIQQRFPAEDKKQINPTTTDDPQSSHFRYQVGEFNGDGRMDLVHWRTPGARVWLSNGDGTFTIQNYAKARPTPEVGVNNTYFKVADFDGDGLSDLMHITGSTGFYVWLNENNGTRFEATGNGFDESGGSDELGLNQYKIVIGDFNGDGKQDFFNPRSDDSAEVWISKGNGHFDIRSLEKPESGFLGHDYMYFPGDLNADGFSDLIQVMQDGTWRSWLGQIDGDLELKQSHDPDVNYFSNFQRFNNTNYYLEPYRFQMGDYNGDGRTDVGLVLQTFWARTQTQSPKRTLLASTYLSQSARPSRLSTILDSYNNETQISYATLTQSNYTPASPNQQFIGTINLPGVPPIASFSREEPVYPEITLTPAMRVVSEVKTSDGIKTPDGISSWGINRYHYSSLRAHLQGLGLLGFQRIEQESASSWRLDYDSLAMGDSNYVDTRYLTDSSTRTYGNPSIIRQYHRKKLQGTVLSNQLLNLINYQYEDVFSNDPHRFYHYVKTHKAEVFDLDGTAITRTNTTNTVDTYGMTLGSNTTVHDLQNNMHHKTDMFNEYVSPSDVECDIPDQTQARLIKSNRITKSTSDTGLPFQSSSATRRRLYSEYNENCLLQKEVIEPDSPELSLTNTYAYSGSQLLQHTVEGAGISTYIPKRHTYDAKGRMTHSKNAYDVQETYHYDALDYLGLPKEIVGYDGLKTQRDYDGLGRLTQEIYPDGRQAQYHYGLCGRHEIEDVSCEANSIEYYFKRSQVTGESPITIYYDSLDRQVRSVSYLYTNGQARPVVQRTQYNAAGQAYKASLPHFAGDAVYWEITAYDFNHRPTLVTHADLTQTRYEYSGLETLITNMLDQTKMERKLAWGGVLWVENANQHKTHYQYDAFGNLVRTTDSDDNQIKNQFDIRGRKIYMEDPDLGTWSYKYDTLNRLVEQTDAKGNKTVMHYDQLGRMHSREYHSLNGEQPNATSYWQYSDDSLTPGAYGRLIKEYNNGKSRSYEYDHFGRQIKTITEIDEGVGKGVYETRQKFDAYGRVSMQTYPNNGLQLRYQYHVQTGERLATFNAETGERYWQLGERNARGQLLSETLGDHISSRRDIDYVTGRSRHISGSVMGIDQHHLSYTYDALGNVKVRHDQVNDVEEEFEYDVLNRLTEIRTIDRYGMTKVNMDYDAIGNITLKSDVGTYRYNESDCELTPGPHAVTSTVNGSYSARYCYDVNGNMIRKDVTDGLVTSYNYTMFNKPNRLYQSDGVEIKFEYGPNHERYRQTRKTPNGDTQTTVYLPNYERIQTDDSLIRKYYVAGYGVVIKQVGRAEKTHYFLKDHIGSINTILDSSGAVVERMSFDAWGKRRLANFDPVLNMSEYWYPSSTTRGFTGHEMLDAVGLVHMNGRVYDPIIARFLSPDPIIQAPKMSESYNRYSYVMNNPLYFTDPSGYSWLSDKWKDIRKIAITVAVFVVCPQCSFAVQMAVATTAHTYRHAKDKGASTGSALRMAAKAGITSYATSYMAQGIKADLPVLGEGGSLSNLAPNVFAHGVVGAMSAGFNGGNPLDGFKYSVISAGLGKGLVAAEIGNTASRTIAAGLVAGAIAKERGQNPYFAFSFAAIQHYYNAEGGGASKYSEEVPTVSKQANGRVFHMKMPRCGNADCLLYGANINSKDPNVAAYLAARTRDLNTDISNLVSKLSITFPQSKMLTYLGFGFATEQAAVDQDVSGLFGFLFGRRVTTRLQHQGVNDLGAAAAGNATADVISNHMGFDVTPDD